MLKYIDLFLTGRLFMRVLVAMSGGVDSTVAAKILMEEGWEVGGAYMRMLPPELSAPGDSCDAEPGCKSA